MPRSLVPIRPNSWLGSPHLTFSCWVPGKPVPKQRARFDSRKAKGKRGFTPEATRKAEERFQQAAFLWMERNGRVGKLWDGPVSLRAYFLYSPADWKRGHGDYDNLVKVVTDGLQAVLFDDDRNVMLVERIVVAPWSRKSGTFVVVNLWG